MGLLLADGFDLYATSQPPSANDFTLSGGLWNSANIGTAIQASPTRFGVGKSLWVGKSGITGGVLSSQSFGPSTSTVYVNFAFMQQYAFGAAADTYYTLYGGGVAQVTLHFSSVDEKIYVRTGGSGGTIVGTFNAAFTQNVWNHYQFKIIISPTAGEVHCRLNGSLTDTWSVVGINTRPGASNFFDSLGITNPQTAGYTDDLLIIDDSGTTAMNTWVGDVRCWIMSPAAVGTNTQFTSAPPQSAVGSSTTGTNTSHLANEMWVTPSNVTPGAPTFIDSITIQLAAALTGNINCAIYDNTNASNAGNVLGTSPTVTNPAAGNVTFTFATPVSLIGVAAYRVAINSDSNPSVIGGATSATWEKKTGVTFPTYPANPTGFTTTVNTWFWSVNYHNANFYNVSELASDGDTTYNFSNTVGAIDSYHLSALAGSPTAVLMAQVRTIARMSDNGARTAATYFKSGASVVTGASVPLASSYQYMPFQQYLLDPATGAAWTVAAINAVEIGIKVVS
jgi:hypothetical protein